MIFIGKRVGAVPAAILRVIHPRTKIVLLQPAAVTKFLVLYFLAVVLQFVLQFSCSLALYAAHRQPERIIMRLLRQRPSDMHHL